MFLAIYCIFCLLVLGGVYFGIYYLRPSSVSPQEVKLTGSAAFLVSVFYALDYWKSLGSQDANGTVFAVTAMPVIAIFLFGFLLVWGLSTIVIVKHLRQVIPWNWFGGLFSIGIFCACAYVMYLSLSLTQSAEIAFNQKSTGAELREIFERNKNSLYLKKY